MSILFFREDQEDSINYQVKVLKVGYTEVRFIHQVIKYHLYFRSWQKEGASQHAVPFRKSKSVRWRINTTFHYAPEGSF